MIAGDFTEKGGDAMAWIESHQELWRHPKTKKLARLLGVSVPTVVGHLHGIWYWALDFAQDGDLRRYDPEEIADAALWEGEPGRFIEALVAAGYLDQTDNGLAIHDWYDYAGRLIEQREARREQDRARKQRQRERKKVEAHDGHGEVTEESRVTPGNVTLLPYLTKPNQTEQDNTETTTPPSPSDEGSDGGTKSLVEARFLEFWKAYPKKTGKQYALKAWNKIKPTAELHERIMQAVDAQKRSDQWHRENGRYIPNPSTWLNGGYWDNEEVNEGAENQRDPEQPDSSGRDWGKGFKPADDEHV